MPLPPRAVRLPSTLVLALAVASATVSASPSSCASFVPSKFVSPASPQVVLGGPAPTPAVLARNRAVATGYGTKGAASWINVQTSVGQGSRRRQQQILFAKKKKGGAIKGGKIQVKLLKHVAGTGQAGDVVMVTPAFFQNKLSKTKSAMIITDEAVAREKSEKAASEKEATKSANAIKTKVEEMDLKIPRKAGPEGHLFGGVGPKVILDELQKQFPKGVLGGKGVKVVKVVDGEGSALDHDIKELGSYSATLSLMKGVSADVSVSVVEDK